MLKLKVIEKGIKLAEKLYKKEWNTEMSKTAYLELDQVRYDLYDGEAVEISIRWGQQLHDGNFSEDTVFLPSYVKTAGQIAWFVIGYVIAKEF